MSERGVRRAKAALSSGCKPHPAIAPAGSNRSSHGGNEVAEANCTSLALAEWFCRAVDRIDPARVLGPHHCLRRGASAPDSKIIRRLRQLRQNASVFAQGSADFSPGSADRNHSFTPDPRWASPSLRPRLSFRYTQQSVFIVNWALWFLNQLLPHCRLCFVNRKLLDAKRER